MKGVGGNVEAAVQLGSAAVNEIGERVQTWQTVQVLRGWLDLMNGDSGYTRFGGKVQSSTHLFIGDYVPLDARVTAENSRLVIEGKPYDIMLLDNPMGLREESQWEIYLKYTGGQPV